MAIWAQYGSLEIGRFERCRRRPAQPPAGRAGHCARLEHFRAKWAATRLRVKKMRQNKNIAPRSDSIGTEKALRPRNLRVAGAADVETRLTQAAAAANTESIFAFNVEALNGFTM
jgi:hypothetical protein